MRLTMKTAALSAALALAGSAFVAGPAMAAPKDGTATTTVTCGSVTTPVTINGNGQWTPARATNSTRVFIPVGFSNFVGTVEDSAGNVLDTFTDPTQVFKPGVRVGQGMPLTCTFNGSEGPVDDPVYGPGVTFSFTGTVLVQTKR